MAIDRPNDKEASGSPPNAHLWSRDGFVGNHAIALRAGYIGGWHACAATAQPI